MIVARERSVSIKSRAQRFRQKFLLRLATSPITLVPAVGGLTAMLASWGLDLPGAVAFAGLASVLVAAGTFLTRIVTQDEANAKAALEEVEQEMEREREAALDDLERRLSSDNDPRDESLLRDLRALATALRSRDLWPAAFSTHTTVDIMSGVEQLFALCVSSLERELRLLQIAAKMTTDAARAPILARREQILADIGRSIEQLSRILTHLQGMHSEGSDSAELQRIQQELDQSLEIAARVEERMKTWQGDRGELDLS